jgi:hypothetical protein
MDFIFFYTWILLQFNQCYQIKNSIKHYNMDFVWTIFISKNEPLTSAYAFFLCKY